MMTKATIQITRREYYARLGEWDGRCFACGHDYFTCRGNCTCLSCNAQRQTEVEDGLIFPEDEKDEDYIYGLLLGNVREEVGD
jgi:hypothetical protein